MVETEKGTNVAIFVKLDETVTTSHPPLGTTTVEPSATGPTTAVEQLLLGQASITLPIDNDPQEVVEIGKRTVQKLSGLFKQEGRIELFKTNGEMKGAVLGKASYATGPVTTYSPADEMPRYKIIIIVDPDNLSTLRDATYGAGSGQTKDSTLFTGAGNGTEKVTLEGVKFTSYDTSIETGLIKETITYTAETITVERS